MDPRVWNQVGLELGHVDIQGSIKPQRGSQGRDHLNQKNTHQSPHSYFQVKLGADYYLRDKAVEIGVSGALDVKGSPANVIDSLIVEKHGDVSVLEEGMCGKDAVVRLYNGCGDLW